LEARACGPGYCLRGSKGATEARGAVRLCAPDALDVRALGSGRTPETSFDEDGRASGQAVAVSGGAWRGGGGADDGWKIVLSSRARCVGRRGVLARRES